MRLTRPLAAIAVSLALAGCAAAPGKAGTSRSSAPPAAIRHVVLIELADPAELAALVADCDAKLAVIPEVTSYWRGKPVDIGRANVDGDYTLGISVDFDSLDAYGRYLRHPAHEELVRTWKPKWKAARIFDVGLEPR
jgi:hypothetical protein